MSSSEQERTGYHDMVGVALGGCWLEVDVVSDLVDSSSVDFSFLRTREGKVMS